MYDYSNLPELVFDEILRHLNIKEQIGCKTVCRNWKHGVERWENQQSQQSLVFYLYTFPANLKWTHSATPMRLESSFPINSLDFLRRPSTQHYFKELKKVAIINIHDGHVFRNGQSPQYIDWLVQCEELEVSGLDLEGETTFDLPKVKVIVMKKVEADRLKFKCPTLEVLAIQSKVNQFKLPFAHNEGLAISDTGGLTFRQTFRDFSSFEGFPYPSLLKPLPNPESMNVFKNDHPYVRDTDRLIREVGIKDAPNIKILIYYANGKTVFK